SGISSCPSRRRSDFACSLPGPGAHGWGGGSASCPPLPSGERGARGSSGRAVMASRTAAVLGKVIRSVANADWSGVSDAELLRRFAAEKDQAAFAAMVGRHTGMVLGVCRRALPHWQGAQDACQATFRVLSQKARGARWRPSVAGWLYTTARKVAHNARVAARRRATRECRAAVPEAVEAVDRMTGRELLAILDEELERLPSR